MTVVVNTNVLLVANEQHPDVSPVCQEVCRRRLLDIQTSGRVAIDDGYRILSEYQNKSAPYAGKRVGDVFLKWLLRNIANTARCDQISLADHDERGFESFPDDASLAGFDASDRKFVAVAAAHPDNPPILQATDSKWLDWAPTLETHGLKVEFLYVDDIKKFDAKKKGKKDRK